MSQDDLALGARIDRLTRAVEDLATRVDQQEEGLSARVDSVARRLAESAERLEQGLAASDSEIAQRLEQATTSVRARVEQMLGEVHEQLAAERDGTREQLTTRADRLEQVAGALAEVLPELRDATSSVGSTATGLSVSASGLAGYVQEVVSRTEQVGPEVEQALVLLDERVRAAMAGIESRIDEARDRELDEVRDQLAAATATVADLRDEVAATVERTVREATAAHLEQHVATGFSELRDEVLGRVAELQVTATEMVEAGQQERRRRSEEALDDLRTRATTALEGLGDELVAGFADQVDTAVARFDERAAAQLEVGQQAVEELTTAAAAMQERSRETGAELQTTVQDIGVRLDAGLEEALARMADESAASVTDLHGLVAAMLDQVTAMEEAQQLAARTQLEELTGQHGAVLEALQDGTATQAATLEASLRDVGGEVAGTNAAAAEELRTQVADALAALTTDLATLTDQLASAVGTATQHLTGSAATATDDLTATTTELRATVLDQLADLRQLTAATDDVVRRVDEEQLAEVRAATEELRLSLAEVRDASATSREQLRQAATTLGDRDDAQRAALAASVDDGLGGLRRAVDELRSSVSEQSEQVGAALTASVEHSTEALSASTQQQHEELTAALDELQTALAARTEQDAAALRALLEELGEASAIRAQDAGDRLEARLEDVASQVTAGLAEQRAQLEESLLAGQERLATSLTINQERAESGIAQAAAEVADQLAQVGTGITLALATTGETSSATIREVATELHDQLAAARAAIEAVVAAHGERTEGVLAGTTERLRSLVNGAETQLSGALSEHEQAIVASSQALEEAIRTALAEEAGGVRSALAVAGGAIHDAATNEAAATRDLLERLAEGIAAQLDRDAVAREELTERARQRADSNDARVGALHDRIDAHAALLDLTAERLERAAAETGERLRDHGGRLTGAVSEVVGHTERFGELTDAAHEALQHQLLVQREAALTAAADLGELLRADNEELRALVDRVLTTQQEDVARFLADGQEEVARHVAANRQAVLDDVERAIARMQDLIAEHVDVATARLHTGAEERVAAFEQHTIEALDGLVGAASSRSGQLLEELLSDARVAVDEQTRQVVAEAAQDLRRRADALAALLDETRTTVLEEGTELRTAAQQLTTLSETLQASAVSADKGAAAVQSEVARLTDRAADVEEAATVLATELRAANGVSDRLVEQVAAEVASLADAREAFEQLTDRVVRQVVDESDAVRTKVDERLGEHAVQAREQSARLEAAVGRAGEDIAELMARVDALRSQTDALRSQTDELGAARTDATTEAQMVQREDAVEVLEQLRAVAQQLVAHDPTGSRVAAPRPRRLAAASPTRTVRRADGRGALRLLVSEIDGVGRSRQDAVVDAFGSVRALREASLDEIAAVPGIGAELAARIVSAAESAD